MVPDLNRLKVFTHVYVHRSVTKAAHSLKLSQPAISQHLKKLEKELRIPLFTRSNRRLVPTPAAKRLHERMSPLIDELEKEVTHLRRPLDTPYGLLRIGASDLFAGTHLPSIFTKIRYRFPTVSFELCSGSTKNLLSTLSRGETDLAIIEDCASLLEDETVRSHLFCFDTLIQTPIVLVCSNTYFNRHFSGTASPERLLQREFLGVKAGGYSTELWFQHHFGLWPGSLNYVLKSNNHQSFLAGLRNGMGLGVIPRYLVQADLASRSLVAIEGDGAEILGNLALVQLKNKSINLTEQAFSSILKKELAAAAQKK